MNKNLSDDSKFKCSGTITENDNIAKIETKLQIQLLKLIKSDEPARSVYEIIRLTGAQQSRMYGLPKTHKKNTPLLPMLSMTGSAQYELAKYLSFILKLF